MKYFVQNVDEHSLLAGLNTLELLPVRPGGDAAHVSQALKHRRPGAT